MRHFQCVISNAVNLPMDFPMIFHDIPMAWVTMAVESQHQSPRRDSRGAASCAQEQRGDEKPPGR